MHASAKCDFVQFDSCLNTCTYHITGTVLNIAMSAGLLSTFCAISAVFFDFFFGGVAALPPSPSKIPLSLCTWCLCNHSRATPTWRHTILPPTRRALDPKKQRNLVQTYHNFQYCPENLLDLGFIKDRPWLLWSVENCSVILKLLQRKSWIWFRSFWPMAWDFRYMKSGWGQLVSFENDYSPHDKKILVKAIYTIMSVVTGHGLLPNRCNEDKTFFRIRGA